MKKGIIGVVLLLFMGLVIYVSSLFMEDSSLTHGGHIPDDIGAFYKTNLTEGDEAKEIMNKLHGKEVELDYAYLIEYQTNGGSHGFVWVSESNEDGTPEALFNDMKELITKNKTSVDHSEKIVNKRKVQHWSENDKDYYYFVKENRFIFIETFKDTKQRFIKNAVNIF